MRSAGVRVLVRSLIQGEEILRPVEYKRPHLVVTPSGPVRLLEVAPDHEVVPKRYLDSKRPATRIAAYAAEDCDLSVPGVTVVVSRWFPEQSGRRQKDFLGRQSDVTAGEIGLSLSRGEGLLCLFQDVHEVAAVDEDVYSIDQPAGRISYLADLKTNGVHGRIMDAYLGWTARSPNLGRMSYSGPGYTERSAGYFG